MKIKIFKSEKKFTDESVKFILKICEKKKLVNIALSGGSTPKLIYKALGKKIIAKKLSEKIRFYQVDERYVPAAHTDSNQKMINESLIQKTGCVFNHFDTSIPIKKSIKKYSQQLQKNLDLTVLGIGPDGHIASLFPRSKALTGKSPVAHTTAKEFAVKDRLTLTFSTILKSKKLLVLLKNRPEIIQELKTPKKSFTNFPALKLKSHKKLSIYFQASSKTKNTFHLPIYQHST